MEEITTVSQASTVDVCVSASADQMQRPNLSRGKLLLAGGLLGIVGAGFILAAPELGFLSAVGGVVASVGSAGVTLFARR